LDKFDEKYFAKDKEAKKSREERFFEAGKKPEVKLPPPLYFSRVITNLIVYKTNRRSLSPKLAKPTKRRSTQPSQRPSNKPPTFRLTSVPPSP